MTTWKDQQRLEENSFHDIDPQVSDDERDEEEGYHDYYEQFLEDFPFVGRIGYDCN